MVLLISHIAHPPEVLGSANDQHRRLVAAVRRHDPLGAAREMTEHIHGTEHVLAGLLARRLTRVPARRIVSAAKDGPKHLSVLLRRRWDERQPPPRSRATKHRLAELGYKQELNRGWSGFSNFAISLTIICILSGCFTTYGQAWNDGGPVAISIGWPVISVLVLLVGLSMAELASKYPTAGGIYYWAYSLGGVRWAWFTGWFNLLGLVAIIAAVDYGAAAFLNSVLGLYGLHFILNFTTTNPSTGLHNTFILFVLILAAHGLINVFSSPLVALLNRVSAWWMLGGVVVIVAVLIFGPSSHQSFSFVFGHRANNSGFSGSMYWFFILPLGFLLTMYTFTGYDASAHLSEETHDAERAAPRGLWTSIAYSAVGGWALLLAITFAATHVDAINKGGGGAIPSDRDRAQQRPREARARHLDRRPAVLRDGLRRGRLADGVRLLP